jgi:hypothetical protein
MASCANKGKFDLDPRAIDGLRKRGLSWFVISKTLEDSVKAIRRVHADWLRAKAPRENEQQTKQPPRAVGRPRRGDLDPVLIDALRRRNIPWRTIAKAGHAGVGTVRRIHAAWLDKLSKTKRGQKANAPKPPARAKIHRRPVHEA